jgi:hypothetical protein
VNWLQRFLDQSVDQNLCTSSGCTTCGAAKFRDGLYGEVDIHLTKPKSVNGTIDRFSEIARKLADVRPNGRTAFHTQAKFEEAVRFIFTEAWSILGDATADRIITPLLGDCWAGDLLARMKLHHEKRLQDLRKQADNANPERVRERREAKRQLRQMRHADRLERKRVRDKDRNKPPAI